MSSTIVSVTTNVILSLIPEVVRSWFAISKPKCISKSRDVIDEGTVRFQITNRGRSITRLRVMIYTPSRPNGIEPELEWHESEPFETRHSRAFKVVASELYSESKSPESVRITYMYTGRITPLEKRSSRRSMRRIRKLLPAAIKHAELRNQRVANNSPVARWMRGEDINLSGRGTSPLGR